MLINPIQRCQIIRNQFQNSWSQIRELFERKNFDSYAELCDVINKIYQGNASCIIHKKETRQEPCIDCRWEEFQANFKPHESGIRYQARQAPLWMYKNRFYGKCWCGKPIGKGLRKYCCSLHADIWNWRIECYWNSFRHIICKRDNGICQECNRVVFKMSKKFNLFQLSGMTVYDWEVDHITAISLGGKCYDPLNVRLLCRDCHNKKTGSDLKKLALRRKNQTQLTPTLELVSYN